jgi:hypothetical protein
MQLNNSFVLDRLAHARHEALLSEAAQDRLSGRLSRGPVRTEVIRGVERIRSVWSGLTSLSATCTAFWVTAVPLLRPGATSKRHAAH